MSSTTPLTKLTSTLDTPLYCLQDDIVNLAIVWVMTRQSWPETFESYQQMIFQWPANSQFSAKSWCICFPYQLIHIITYSWQEWAHSNNPGGMVSPTKWPWCTSFLLDDRTICQFCQQTSSLPGLYPVTIQNFVFYVYEHFYAYIPKSFDTLITLQLS